MNINEEKATEIFEYLQNKLDCDFNTTRRQRRYVYAKKVFFEAEKTYANSNDNLNANFFLQKR